MMIISVVASSSARVKEMRKIKGEWNCPTQVRPSAIELLSADLSPCLEVIKVYVAAANAVITGRAHRAVYLLASEGSVGAQSKVTGHHTCYIPNYVSHTLNKTAPHYSQSKRND